MDQLLGGIEAGGTKFVCAVGAVRPTFSQSNASPPPRPRRNHRPRDRILRRQRGKLGPLAAIGIASFGPIDPRRGSPTFGYITSTPKPRLGQHRLCRRRRPRAGRAGRLRHRRQRRGAGRMALGRRPGRRQPDLSDDRHRHRRRRAGQRQADARPGSSRDGTHPHSARPGGRSLSRTLPVSRRLPGRSGLRTGHQRSLEATERAACRPIIRPGRSRPTTWRWRW